MSLADMPVVTVEQIVRFREAALKVEQQRDKLLEALKAFMALDEEFSTAKRKHVEEIAQAGGKMAQAVLLARDAIAEVEASK